MTTAELLTGANLVGTAEIPGATSAFRAVNPVTGTALEPEYRAADAATVARAAAAAWSAFAGYRATDFTRRAAFLDSIAGEIENLGEDLAQRAVAESGLPEARIRGEIARTTGQLRLFADVVREGSWTGARLDRPDPARAPLPKPDLRQRRIPLGPVAVFAASNFPLAFSVAGGDTASALAAGAPVVVKAHPSHPGTSELVARAVLAAVREHGLPEGTFALVHGGVETGLALVRDPHIRAVGFTGSRQAGLALTAAAAARPVPIPVFAEMSSVNPVFVLPGALAEHGARLGAEFVASLTTGVGQLCTSPGLVFLADGPGADEFVAAATAAVGAASGAPMLNAGIAASFAAGVERLTGTDGVELAATGTAGAASCSGNPNLFVTTAARFRADRELQDEVFGPSSIIVRAADTAELLALAGELEGQLTATVHTTAADRETARPLLGTLELIAGRVLFDGWPTGVEVGHAVVHGGPFPATSAPATTSVGSRAIERFLRPVSYQNVPEELLADEIRAENPLGIWRRVDGAVTRD
ncbi:aldehyde dehydrogenase (NADP(+)) [Nocardia sp. NPDC051750]|uniref:aldehyde dehydrogenase (NADP(+)) n=1 Tax=Nocardia sp. NPDC051750 TaxID=3364325 RepID=UPI0037A49FB1